MREGRERIGRIRWIRRIVAAGVFLLSLCEAAGAASPTFNPVVLLDEDSACSRDPAVGPLRSGGYAAAWDDSPPLRAHGPAAADRCQRTPGRPSTWFFWGGLSNVDFDITVTDIETLTE